MTQQLEKRLYEIEQQLRSIYVDANNTRQDLRLYANYIVPLLTEARAIDTQLAAYNYPPVVSLPDFEYIRFLGKQFPANQQMVGSMPAVQNAGWGNVSVQAPLQPLGGFGVTNNATVGVNNGGSSDRFAKHAPQQEVFSPFGIDPALAKAETKAPPEKKVPKKLFDGSEYPLMLAQGLTAVLDTDVGNYIKYDVAGKTSLGSRVSKDVFNIKNFVFKVGDKDTRLQAMATTSEPHTLVTTVPNVKRFYIDKVYLDRVELDEVINYAESQTVYDIDTLVTLVNMLYSIRVNDMASVGAWVEDMLVSKFIKHVLYAAVRKNNFNITEEFVSVTAVADVIKENLIDNIKLKPTLIAHNAETFKILAKYVFDLITTSVVEEDEKSICLEVTEPLTYICITEAYLSADIELIRKGESWLIRSDSYPILYQIFEGVYNLSDTFKATRCATVYILDDKQNELRYSLFRDINGNFVIVK